MRNKIWGWNTSATVQHIVSKDGLVFTLGNRFADGSFWFNGCQPWCNGRGYPTGVPGYGNLIIASNGIETRSNALLLSADKPYTKESGWGVTLAYTYTHATQNRSITEHYAFDEPSIKEYPFITSNAAPKHRFVATGSIDGFWGITFGSKLTLATPTPLNDNACYGPPLPSGAPACRPAAALPNDGTKKFLVGGDVFGYRDIDFQATKNFDLTHGMSVYVRFDLLNAFNYKNYSDYSVNWGSDGVFNPNVVYNTTGNITGVPRTFKLSAGFRW
jgi:hypothetical protein